MNILLINPWVTDFAAFDLWSKPLGLLYAGAFLRARGHRVRLVDCMHRYQGPEGYIGGEDKGHGEGKFRREVLLKPPEYAHVPRYYCRYGISVDLFRELATGEPRPDVALVTGVMTYWYPGVFEAIRLLREILPGTPIALGGIYAALCPQHARERSGADVVVAESRPSGIITEIEALAGKAGTGSIPADPFPAWPAPLWDLYDHLPAALVMTSRGCPMRCTACASHLLCDSFERCAPGDAFRMIRNLIERGVRDIAFADDALLLDAARYAAPLFAELGDAGSPVHLHTPNGLHVREITPELARLMRRAGMKTLRLSLETASDEEARRRFSGKVSREHFARAVVALFQAGFETDDLGAYILAGLPGESPESVWDTVVFSQSLGVKVRPALFSPVPGTVEFDRSVRSGLLSPDADPLFHNNTLRTLDLWGGDGAYERFVRAVRVGNARIGGG